MSTNVQFSVCESHLPPFWQDSVWCSLGAGQNSTLAEHFKVFLSILQYKNTKILFIISDNMAPEVDKYINAP
jgi:hypothetical protein